MTRNEFFDHQGKKLGKNQEEEDNRNIEEKIIDYNFELYHRFLVTFLIGKFLFKKYFGYSKSHVRFFFAFLTVLWLRRAVQRPWR